MDPEALVLHVLAERTQEQVEAELGEGAEAGEGAEVPEPVAPAEAPEGE
jgi:hypothetical protein